MQFIILQFVKHNGWQLIREGEILYHHQKTFVPDFTFRHEDGTEVLLEIVGFRTPEYPAHKREEKNMLFNRVNGKFQIDILYESTIIQIQN